MKQFSGKTSEGWEIGLQTVGANSISVIKHCGEKRLIKGKDCNGKTIEVNEYNGCDATTDGHLIDCSQIDNEDARISENESERIYKFKCDKCNCNLLDEISLKAHQRRLHEGPLLIITIVV